MSAFYNTKIFRTCPRCHKRGLFKATYHTVEKKTIVSCPRCPNDWKTSTVKREWKDVTGLEDSPVTSRS